jgi:hypothetical protein
MKPTKSSNKKKRSVAIIALLSVALMGLLVYALPELQDQSKPTRVVGGRANVKQIYFFDDVNDTQLEAAQAYGIPPLKTRDDIDSLLIEKLYKVESSNLMYLEKLTHSLPYLTPNAGHLLESIAMNFQDKLQDRGLAQYQIVVTSLLRTEDDVRQLQRVNSNAVRKSCHMYGTTFDLSWVRFVPYENDYLINAEDLKNVLGHVLLDFKNKNRCNVLYESGQCCFHITVI